jgi:hypothetical protein
MSLGKSKVCIQIIVYIFKSALFHCKTKEHLLKGKRLSTVDLLVLALNRSVAFEIAIFFTFLENKLP